MGLIYCIKYTCSRKSAENRFLYILAYRPVWYPGSIQAQAFRQKKSIQPGPFTALSGRPWNEYTGRMLHPGRSKQNMIFAWGQTHKK